MKHLLLLVIIFCFYSEMNAQCSTPVSSISENFDSNPVPNGPLPPCWSTPSGNVTLSAQANLYGYQYTLGYVSMYSTSGQVGLAVLPKVDNVQGILTFKVDNVFSPNGFLTMEVGTMSDPNNPATFTVYTGVQSLSSSYSSKTTNFANYTGTDQYIAFRSHHSGSYSYRLDNITYNSFVPNDTPIYVDADATGANDGTSWTDAYTDLQDALTNAIMEDSIWVAEGTYKPHASDRTAYFNISNKVNVFGGFNGTEVTFEQRDPKTNVTTLSGDLLGNDNANIIHTEATRQDNSYHVITLRGNIEYANVDGFTISGGNANGTANNSCAVDANIQSYNLRGAAIYANPYVSGQSIEAKIINCILENNTAISVGVYSPFTPCGVTDLTTDVDFESCIIRNNYSNSLSAMFFAGNLMNNIYARGSVINSLFYDNASTVEGSCLYLSSISSDPSGVDFDLINSTLAYNTSSSGAAITMNYSSNSRIKNSIIYGNGSNNPFLINTSGSVVSNSIVQGGQQGGMNANPLFTYPGNGDYSLQAASPAVNIGDNADVPSSLIFDLAGNNRVHDGTVDLGAYESQINCDSTYNVQVAVDVTRAGITWDAIQGVSSYDLVYVASGQPLANGTTIPNINTNYYNLSGLANLTDYDVYVGVLCSFTGAFVYSDVVTFQTTDEPTFVDKNATGNNDGSSWTDAYTDLQSALAVANASKPIWVAAGIYTPHVSDRNATFNILTDSKIFGGFNGTETTLAERDLTTNITILSGDLSANDNTTLLDTEATRQDNAYHVVSIKGDARNILVNGFTISGGNANGGIDNSCSTPAASQYFHTRGGGIYVNPYAHHDALSAAFQQCIIEKNTGISVAAFSYFSPCGIGYLSYDVDFESCIIRDNYSQDLPVLLFSASGGYNIFGSGSLVNCLLYNNTSANSASSLYLGSSTGNGGTTAALDFDLINTTFSNNTATNGHVIKMVHAENAIIKNTIIHGNGSSTPFDITSTGSSLSHSIVEGGQLGGTDSDPLFIDVANHNYSLSATSPAIGTGDYSGFPLPRLDLAGNPRLSNILDMGAYEFNRNLYVDHTATGANNGASWADAFTDLQNALAIGVNAEILIAKGTYKPTTGTGRGVAFEIPDGAEIYGGYPNGGGTRNVASNEVTLSGNIDNVSSYAGNSFHVVVVKNADNVILDGISIRDGNADNANSFGRSRGGGLFVNNATLTLNNTTVKWNKGIYGAGMFATLSNNVTINESSFKKNEGDYGSAIYHSNQTNLYIIKSRITDNTALIRVAIEVNNSLFTRIENSLIADNPSANANAIGFISTNRDGLAEIVNSTILGDVANKNLITMQVGFGDQLDLFIDNSIIGHQNGSFTKAFKDYNNGVLNLVTNNCYIQGSTVIGTSNNNLYSAINGALLLNADFSLMRCSPGVNQGLNGLAAGTTDIDGNNRIINSIVDMGAYEISTTCFEPAFSKKNLSSIDATVFPNPTKGQIFIKTDVENLSFQLYDLLGKNIMNTSVKEINISQFPQGMYMLRIIKQGELIGTRKIIKE